MANALFGLVALHSIHHFRGIFGSLADSRAPASLAAGAGASATLRTRIALFKSADGKDEILPLDYCVTELLALADKYIDRFRAERRREIAELSMADIRALGSFKQAANHLLVARYSHSKVSGRN